MLIRRHLDTTLKRFFAIDKGEPVEMQLSGRWGGNVPTTATYLGTDGNSSQAITRIDMQLNHFLFFQLDIIGVNCSTIKKFRFSRTVKLQLFSDNDMAASHQIAQQALTEILNDFGIETTANGSK